MPVKCKKCGGPHPVWDCTATPAKVAAYEAGPRAETLSRALQSEIKPTDAHIIKGETSYPVPKVGRPKIHPDRKAYKAQKERERRAKAKT